MFLFKLFNSYALQFPLSRFRKRCQQQQIVFHVFHLEGKKKHESSQTLRTATRKEKNLVNNFFHFTSRHWNYLSNNFSMLFFFVWLLKRCFSANKLYLMSYKNMLQGWQRKLLRWHEKMLQELLIKCPTDILLMRFFHGKFKNKSRKEKKLTLRKENILRRKQNFWVFFFLWSKLFVRKIYNTDEVYLKLKLGSIHCGTLFADNIERH